MNKDDLFGSTLTRFEDMGPPQVKVTRTDRTLVELYGEAGYPIAICDGYPLALGGVYPE